MNSFSSGKTLPDIILYEDRDIIVCHKPAGIPVQTGRIGTRDMASILKNHLASEQETPGKADREPYLAIIHRLDQPVEGLLVFAKTPSAAKELSRQLTSSGFGKYYRALVCGHPHPAEGTLENYMVKDARTNSSRVCTENTPGAKKARLHYRTMETSEETSLLEIHLDTGRHHQIRVQMAALGCPIAGDRKYGKDPACQSSTAAALSAASTDRIPLQLCAYRLEFRHPASGRPMHFELPWQPAH